LVSGVFSLPLLDPVTPQREFIAGDENVLVRAAVNVVLQHQADRLPLVIYGPTGSGKTFLAEGLAEAWRQAGADHQPPRNVLRISGVDFARGYAEACQVDSIADFRDQFLHTDFILVDAVHTLASKERAAREFCFQLSGWLNAGIVVLVTSLKSPPQLPDAGLASRLSAGLVVPLALPSPVVRRTLLAQFAQQRSLDLSDDLLEFLAQRIPGAVSSEPSPRDLLAALTQLESTASLTGSPIDERLIASLFQGALPSEEIEFKRILAAVCKRYGVTADELRSSSRRQTLVRARGVAVVLARRLTGESLQSLGKLLGKRDHSTIHHALQSTEQALASDENLEQLLVSLQQELVSGGKAAGRG
jgi:chromosomal replication initiator protein